MVLVNIIINNILNTTQNKMCKTATFVTFLKIDNSL